MTETTNDRLIRLAGEVLADIDGGPDGPYRGMSSDAFERVLQLAQLAQMVAPAIPVLPIGKVREVLEAAQLGQQLVESICEDVLQLWERADPSLWAEPWAVYTAADAIMREFGTADVLRDGLPSALKVGLGAVARASQSGSGQPALSAETLGKVREEWRRQVRDALRPYIAQPSPVALDRLLAEIEARTDYAWQPEQLRRELEEQRALTDRATAAGEALLEQREAALEAARISTLPGPPLDRDEIIRLLIEAYLEIVEGDGIGAYDVARTGADLLLGHAQITALSRPERRCKSCGCTDDYCGQCIRKTGQPCRWAADDLCTACLPDLTTDRTGD